MKTTKAHVQSFVKSKLSTDATWAVKAMVRIFNENQMADEKQSEHTIHNNGIGFNGIDSTILSSFAQQVIRGRSLSTKQMAIVFKKMPRYARQVIAFSDMEKLTKMVEAA